MVAPRPPHQCTPPRATAGPAPTVLRFSAHHSPEHPRRLIVRSRCCPLSEAGLASVTRSGRIALALTSPAIGLIVPGDGVDCAASSSRDDAALVRPRQDASRSRAAARAAMPHASAGASHAGPLSSRADAVLTARPARLLGTIHRSPGVVRMDVSRKLRGARLQLRDLGRLSAGGHPGAARLHLQNVGMYVAASLACSMLIVQTT